MLITRKGLSQAAFADQGIAKTIVSVGAARIERCRLLVTSRGFRFTPHVRQADAQMIERGNMTRHASQHASKSIGGGRELFLTLLDNAQVETRIQKLRIHLERLLIGAAGFLKLFKAK